ncbi:GNAT family N-acetyltransferase [Umezawaea sp. Da 62-37]|uniref:GNAT family N-acetyltransferase n=1 Tax=Umezawaea sp. Da 62-37 TaxID=3075927 RepID=UPI0028F710E2|nr:GNAT family N-acetyltransferase [Umezawaea sp. Da 62-37]WNV82100.1 GNAT family N-acetyltransferase [Umezawaea sp. Da 62-37]
MRALHSPDAVADATPDLLPRWASQALLAAHPAPGGAAWEHGGAVGVLAPGLNRRERLVLAGPPEGIAAILHDQARAHGPDLNPLVPDELAAPVTALVPDVVAWAGFGWMESTGPLPSAPGVRWLRDGELDQAEALLRKVNPNAYVVPREPGARRWAGAHVDGELVAVGADAWSAPHVGFVAGVVTHPDFRRRGLSKALCSFVVHALLAEHPACALMVDRENDAAITVYRGLGFRYRGVTILLPAEVAAARPPRRR